MGVNVSLVRPVGIRGSFTRARVTAGLLIAGAAASFASQGCGPQLFTRKEVLKKFGVEIYGCKSGGQLVNARYDRNRISSVTLQTVDFQDIPSVSSKGRNPVRNECASVDRGVVNVLIKYHDGSTQSLGMLLSEVRGN